jgi:hypothetical protein
LAQFTSHNSKKPKCLPQAQHRHFGCFATRWYVKLSLASSYRVTGEFLLRDPPRRVDGQIADAEAMLWSNVHRRNATFFTMIS